MEMGCDLFGEPIRAIPERIKGDYAKQPGSGPIGERCGTCEHYTRVQSGAGIYRKCALMEPSWTRGPGTDIKMKSPACSRWEKINEEGK